MDAIAFLRSEHERFRTAIARLHDRKEALPNEAFVAFSMDLIIHAAVEEELLYPRITLIPVLRDGTRHAYHEHHLLDVQLDELANIPPAEQAWGDKLHVLKETLEHHLDEEEEDVFPVVQKHLSREELIEMGDSMTELQEEYRARYGSRPPATAQGAAEERIRA